MNKFKTLCIYASLLLSYTSTALASNSQPKTSDSIGLIKNYIQNNNDYFRENKINTKFLLFKNSEQIKLSDKQEKCLTNPLCKSEIKFDALTFTSTKNISFEKAEQMLSSYFNKDIKIVTKSSFKSSSIAIFLFSLSLFFISIILYKRERKLNKLFEAQIIDAEVLRLVQTNKQLQREVEGMKFLGDLAHIEYKNIKRKFEMSQRLPDNLKVKLRKYKINSSSLNL